MAGGGGAKEDAEPGKRGHARGCHRVKVCIRAGVACTRAAGGDRAALLGA